MSTRVLVTMGFMAASFAVAEITPGPKGGKLLESEPLHAEFFVNAERKVELTFYDHDPRALPLSGQSATAMVERPEGKVRLEFETRDQSLVSTQPLPDGDGYRVVVQIRETAEARPQNFRIDYHAEVCGECDLAEYACVCDHADAGGEHGHGH